MKKKVLLGFLITLTVLVTGCDFFLDENVTKYQNYIRSAMDASYYGDINEYVELSDSTTEEAETLYDNTIQYLAEAILTYNDVNYNYISDETLLKYYNLSKSVLMKTKYVVNPANKVDGKYQVKVEIQPLDIWESTYDEVEDYIEKFNQKYPNYSELTEAELLVVEDEYANEVLNIITKYVTNMTYKDTVTKIVEININDDGLYGISTEDWNDIDDYIMGIK